MRNEHAAVAHWNGDFDDRGLQGWAEELRRSLEDRPVSLGLVFLAPRHFSNAPQILEILRIHASIPVLIGCSSAALIAAGQEIEESAGIVLGLFSLPDTTLQACHFTPEQVNEAGRPEYWHSQTQIRADQTNGWLVFADPFHFDPESWLRGWNEAYPSVPILGGLASGDAAEQATQIYLNDEVHSSGGVALSINGGVRLAGVISQGCTPIGETWTITKVDGHLIHEIANRPAYQVLADTYNGLSAADQNKARGNLLVGLVLNEYLDEFQRGDFLIRNLLGADPQSGSIAVGALPRSGQTIQFQRRDAAGATEDLVALLERARKQFGPDDIFGGCLCSCNGRGRHLFGQSDHDAGLVQQHLGPLGLAGFFCNGEVGPVGDRSFLHGYTASLALFVKA